MTEMEALIEQSHVGHVLSKLQVENRAQAAVQALKRGLISLEDIT